MGKKTEYKVCPFCGAPLPCPYCPPPSEYKEPKVVKLKVEPRYAPGQEPKVVKTPIWRPTAVKNTSTKKKGGK